jgi:hypothetical protein
MPRHLTARSQAGLWSLLVLLVLPLVSVSASAQSRRDGRRSVLCDSVGGAPCLS